MDHSSIFAGIMGWIMTATFWCIATVMIEMFGLRMLTPNDSLGVPIASRWYKLGLAVYLLSCLVWGIRLALDAVLTTRTSALIIGLIVGMWTLAIVFDEMLDWSIVLKMSIVALLHPLLLIISNFGFWVFHLPDFITTTLLTIGTLAASLLIAYLLVRATHRVWVGALGLLFGCGLTVNWSVAIPLSLVCLFGYFGELDLPLLDSDFKPRKIFAIFSFVSLVFVSYYLYMDVAALQGVYYSPSAEPGILLVMTTPIFLIEGYLWRALVDSIPGLK